MITAILKRNVGDTSKSGWNSQDIAVPNPAHNCSPAAKESERVTRNFFFHEERLNCPFQMSGLTLYQYQQADSWE